VGGYDVVADSLRARSLVGYFPERVSLYLDMTVREYLHYVAAMKGVAGSRRHTDVEAALERSTTGDVGHRLIGTLSKGYRQRVGLAQALLGSPRALVLDEPTAGLDPEQVAEMRHLIRGLRGAITVVLSSHILSEVEATASYYSSRAHPCRRHTSYQWRLRHTSQIHLGSCPAEELVTALRAVPGVLRWTAYRPSFRWRDRLVSTART
jgi:ABC-type nitrate/sulfonate/bicarbonate transport system ATPase subunit